MKNALKLFIEFWKLYFLSSFWMIVYLPRLVLAFIMIGGPALPILYIGNEISKMPGYEGATLPTYIISAAFVYYLLHTKWGEWTKKVMPLGDDFNDD